MTKKKLIYILVILLILITGFFVTNYLKNKNQPPIRPIPAPQIPNFIQKGYNINLEIKNEDFNFPSELPTLITSTQTPINHDDAIKFAKNLGFNDDPKTANDTYDGALDIWNNEDYSLIIYEKTSKITYTKNTVSTNINRSLTSSNDIINQAKQFLIKSSLATDDELAFPTITYLNFNGNPHGLPTTTKEKATAYQVNFSPKVSNIKILTLTPQNSPIFVGILANGEIFRADITKIGNLQKSPNTYHIKNFDQFKNTLDQATIVSLGNGELNIPDFNNQIGVITINKAEIVYLVDSNTSSQYQPVFLLTGTVNFKIPIRSTDILLYLPAVTNIP